MPRFNLWPAGGKEFILTGDTVTTRSREAARINKRAVEKELPHVIIYIVQMLGYATVCWDGDGFRYTISSV